MNGATILQLSPSLPVVTPDGKGEAIGWIDYGKVRRYKAIARLRWKYGRSDWVKEIEITDGLDPTGWDPPQDGS